jgi:hypothetical protein
MPHHELRKLQPILLFALLLLAGSMPAGCKKNDSEAHQANQPEDHREAIRGNVHYDGRPVDFGFVVFSTKPRVFNDTRQNAASDNEKVDAESGLPTLFRYGWGVINKDGSYHAVQVPTGDVLVTVFTDPDDFEQALRIYDARAAVGRRPDLERDAQELQMSPPRHGPGVRGQPGWQSIPSRLDRGPGSMSPPARRDVSDFGSLPQGRRGHFNPEETQGSHSGIGIDGGRFSPGHGDGIRSTSRGPSAEQLQLAKLRYQQIPADLKHELARVHHKGTVTTIAEGQTSYDIEIVVGDSGEKDKGIP